MAYQKFNSGDKVRVVSTRLEHKAKHLGDVFTIRTINPNGNAYGETHYSVVESDKCIYVWFNDELELVEDKKVFTYKDLKTGMFGVMTNGAKFVVVNDHIVYQNDGFDCVESFKDNMGYLLYAIDKVWTGVRSFRMLDRVIEGTADYGTLVYDRERDTVKFYNGKVVCIDNCFNEDNYTVGKIYQFKDGIITTDQGEELREYNPVTSFDDFAEWSSAEWIEVVE